MRNINNKLKVIKIRRTGYSGLMGKISFGPQAASNIQSLSNGWLGGVVPLLPAADAIR